MLFTTFEYCVFLAVCILIYYPLSVRGRLVFLLCASYSFYAVWSLKYSLLMASISIWDNLIARLIQSSSTLRRKRISLALGVVGSVSVLIYFKYTNFFLDSITWTGGLFGFPLKFYHLDLILPLGISFHTFQGMSYFIDVYRGQIKASPDLLPYFVYNSFFPQLVAGPIERASEMLPQLNRTTRFHWVNLYRGLNLILWGLVKKVVLADNLAHYADTVFKTSGSRSSAELLLGLYIFAFQIYFDFSGYSDIAIGSGRCFGIRLMRNFNLPYFSVDMVEFWKRWHISLSRWLHDYLYLPLALGFARRGRRLAPWRVYGSLFASMVVGGLWHGANVTFIAWGAYHGFILCANHWLDQNLKIFRKIKGFPLGRLCLTIATFHLVCLSYIFFRSPDWKSTVTYLTGLFSVSALSVQADLTGSYRWLAIIVPAQIIYYGYQREIAALAARPGPIAYAIYLTLCIVAMIAFHNTGGGKFIYFEF